MVVEDDYAAGDEFKMSVSLDYIGYWHLGPMDYTVKIYSKQEVEVLDSKGNTNQIDEPGTV